MLRLIIMPFFLYFWAKHIRAQHARRDAESVHQETAPNSYSEHVVDAEFEELN